MAGSASAGGSNSGQPLSELTLQSATFGTWYLKIYSESREKEYTYQWDGKEKTGKRFDCIFIHRI